jgi:tRNA pseudouridine65 synthase
MKTLLYPPQIPLLYQDASLLIVDKPAGISVHNNEGPENLLALLGQDLHPVHRLDRETSGVQIFARNKDSARRLASEFEGRTVRKVYRGLLRGIVGAEKGVWNAPLSDKSEGRRDPAGRISDQVPCETHYRLLKANRYFSHCEFDLKTGRQHQIRKHAALARHALIGDPRYGDPKYNAKVESIYSEGRMFLHCYEIEIGGQLFRSPLPEVFAKLLSAE